MLSNQPAPEPEATGAGSATWHFPPTPRISTYLTAVTAGEYYLVTSRTPRRRGQVIPLGLACRQSLAAYLEPDDMLTVTGQGFDYYTGLFEMDYPFAKYDQVFVPEFSAGAMENVGCVTFSERMLFRSKVTDMMYELRAHGDPARDGAHVVRRPGDHAVVGRPVAERVLRRVQRGAVERGGRPGSPTPGRRSAAAARPGATCRTSCPSTHPVAADVSTLSEAIANFDGISYAKGASVLKQLVAYVGRDNFFAGIRAYFGEHSWGNARLADLLSALEVSSGQDLGEWSKAWLQTAGPNTLRSSSPSAADGTFAEFAVLQEAPAEHPVLRPHHIAVGLYNRDDDAALVRTHRVEVDVAGAADRGARAGRPAAAGPDPAQRR